MFIASLFAALPCYGLFVPPEEVPVPRLLAAAEAGVTKNPLSAEAHYTLARIHYLAFVRATRTVPAYMPSSDQKELAIPSEYQTHSWPALQRWERAEATVRAELGMDYQSASTARRPAIREEILRIAEKLEKDGWRPAPEIDVALRARHAETALTEFREAIRLGPQQPLYFLGLGSLMEQVVDWKLSEKPPAALLAPTLARLDYADARSIYLRAFRASADEERKQEFQGVEGLIGMVSHEAGRAYLRLSDRARGTEKLTDEKQRREIDAHLEAVRKIPRGIITPIVLSLKSGLHIADLLTPDAVVSFDLRGHGAAERWPWVRGDTGLLVWDPNRRGEITSGRQLFGGYTFQIFRADGYDALAALDDDGDGFLRGAELAGIRVWFDRDGDGRSAPAEVVDLATLGIVGLAVHSTGAEGIHPTNPAGVIFSDGRTLPTWDWMVAPHRN